MLRLELELAPVVEDADTDTLQLRTMTPEKTTDSGQGMTQSQHLRTRSVSLPPVPSCSLSSSALHVDTARCSTRGRSVSAVTLIADSNPAPASAVRASEAFKSTVCTDGETTPTPAYLRAVLTEDACDKSEGAKQEYAEKHRRTGLGPLCAATSKGSQELSSSSSSSTSFTSSSYSTLESKYGRADLNSNSLPHLLSPLPVGSYSRRIYYLFDYLPPVFLLDCPLCHAWHSASFHYTPPF